MTLCCCCFISDAYLTNDTLLLLFISEAYLTNDTLLLFISEAYLTNDTLFLLFISEAYLTNDTECMKNFYKDLTLKSERCIDSLRGLQDFSYAPNFDINKIMSVTGERSLKCRYRTPLFSYIT